MQTQQTTLTNETISTKSVYNQPKLDIHPERYNIVTQSSLPGDGSGGIGASTDPFGF